MTAIHVIDEQFTESATVVAAGGNILAAVVLIATSLEHKINMFYRDILTSSSHLNTDEVTQAIRNNNAESKIGWFFLLVSGRELSEELKKRIRQVYQWRNSLVHYKAEPYQIDDASYLSNRVLCEVRETGVDRVLSLPKDLEEELTTIEHEVIPLLGESHNLAKALFPDNDESAES